MNQALIEQAWQTVAQQLREKFSASDAMVTNCRMMFFMGVAFLHEFSAALAIDHPGDVELLIDACTSFEAELKEFQETTGWRPPKIRITSSEGAMN